MIKAKFPDHIPQQDSKTPVARVNKVLCQLICHYNNRRAHS